MHSKAFLATASTLCALLAGGCSTHQKPIAAVAKAEFAVKQAGQSTAANYSARDLALAREKLMRAQAQLAGDDHEEARWLAEEALVDAQLAEVKAESAEARAVVAQTRASIETSRNQASRR